MRTVAPTDEARPPESDAKHRGMRPWLIVAAALATLIVAFALGAVVGSSGSDGEAQSADVPAIVDQWGGAFVAGDPVALAALYGEGATFNCRAWDFTIDGEEIPDVVMGDGTDFTEFDPTTVLVGDEIVVVDYMVTAVSPSGQSVATPLLAVFDVAPNGLLAGSTIDYDRAAMFPDQF